MKSLFSKTIWAPDALPLIQKDFKPIFRVFLPIVDVLLMVLATWGLLVGSKVITGLTLPGYNAVWSCILGASAFVALVGLAFEFYWLEILAKGSLIISTIVYASLLAFDAATGSKSSGLTLTLALIVSLILAFRIGYLVRLIARREVRQEQRADE